MTTPYLPDLESEERGWYEVAGLVRALTPDECLLPGYYPDPEWAVRDMIGHLGTWLAEAAIQLDQMLVGTYGGHDVDVDRLNAAFLAAMRDQPWDVVWTQACAGRTRMRQAWADLPDPDDEAAWWIRKSAVDHYAEHIERLRAWVEDLVGRRVEEDQVSFS